MLERLRRNAEASSILRFSSLSKESGIAGALGRGVISAVKKNPIATTMTVGALGITAASTPKMVAGSYRKSMAGFDPAVQRQLSGAPPTPPGTT